MFFKNLQIYRLQAPWQISATDLDTQLSRGPFVKCESNQPTSRGWVPPLGDDLLYWIGDHWMVALRQEERLLPVSVVNQETAERADVLETQQGYRPGRKQLRELKERVVEELMPRAFTRQRTTFAWIDPVNGWFVVDASTPSKAEEVIAHLRHCLDEFPIKPFLTENSATHAMADWLASGEAPNGFTIDRDCQLMSVSEDRAAVTYAHHPLESDEIRSHLASGKLPTKLAMTWDDRISFVLTDRLEVKRLAFLDLLKEAAEENAEDAYEQFDADFTLMTGELIRLFNGLSDALGGELIDLAEQGA